MDQAENLRNMIKQQNSPRKTAKVITVTSGKGGVGKSSISVNLAICLSRLGKKVVIIDADLGLSNVEVMLGVRPIYNLADLIFGKKRLKDIITTGPEGIRFISGGSGIHELTNLDKEQIIFLIHKLGELDQNEDYIIIDTGAGISSSVLEFVAASSEVLLVATPEPTSITDAYALLKTLNRRTEFTAGEGSIRLIANRVGSEREGNELYSKLSLVVGKFLNIELGYLGSIPQDGIVSKAVIRQQPAAVLYPTSQFSRAVEDAAGKLSSTEDDRADRHRGIAQLFSHLLFSKTLK